jgi:PEGA domain
MSTRRIAALQAGLLLVAMFANAASRNMMRIKVLNSETRSLSPDDNGVPLNCDQLTFDAYCRSSRTSRLMNTLLVQEGDGAPFRIACTADSTGSKCIHLPLGETFDAKKDKHGVTVYYVDEKGKAQSQWYKLVATGGKSGPPPNAAAAANQPRPTVTENAGRGTAAPVPHTAAPAQNSPVASPTSSAASAQEVQTEKVKCNFSSTPAGAEISIDWRYVGNTPSEIGLTVGTHVVSLSMPGYAEWKRELTVAADSAVNVTATLEKTQP